MPPFRESKKNKFNKPTNYIKKREQKQRIIFKFVTDQIESDTKSKRTYSSRSD